MVADGLVAERFVDEANGLFSVRCLGAVLLAKRRGDFPDIAIREVVANALIHQDFTIGGASVMIEIYSDRVEVSNLGAPVVSVERFIDGYQSRNERLADLTRRMGICEEKSSGIDKVVSAAEPCQLPAPEFWVGHRRTSVIIYGPRPFGAVFIFPSRR